MCQTILPVRSRIKAGMLTLRINSDAAVRLSAKTASMSRCWFRDMLIRHRSTVTRMKTAVPRHTYPSVWS